MFLIHGTIHVMVPNGCYNTKYPSGYGPGHNLLQIGFCDENCLSMLATKHLDMLVILGKWNNSQLAIYIVRLECFVACIFTSQNPICSKLCPGRYPEKVRHSDTYICSLYVSLCRLCFEYFCK